MELLIPRYMGSARLGNRRILLQLVNKFAFLNIVGREWKAEGRELKEDLLSQWLDLNTMEQACTGHIPLVKQPFGAGFAFQM